MSDPVTVQAAQTANHGWSLLPVLTVLSFIGGVILGAFAVAAKLLNMINGKVSTEDMKKEMGDVENNRRECQTMHMRLLERVENKVETVRTETRSDIATLHGKQDATNTMLNEVLVIVKKNGGAPK